MSSSIIELLLGCPFIDAHELILILCLIHNYTNTQWIQSAANIILSIGTELNYRIYSYYDIQSKVKWGKRLLYQLSLAA